jgi:peroxin-5
MYGSNLGAPAFYQGLNPTLCTVSDKGKGKGKARDADFEAAFSQAVASLSITDTGSSARIVELDDNLAATEQVSEEVKTNAEFPEFAHLPFSPGILL